MKWLRIYYNCKLNDNSYGFKEKYTDVLNGTIVYDLNSTTRQIVNNSKVKKDKNKNKKEYLKFKQDKVFTSSKLKFLQGSSYTINKTKIHFELNKNINYAGKHLSKSLIYYDGIKTIYCIIYFLIKNKEILEENKFNLVVYNQLDAIKMAENIMENKDVC